MPNIERPVLGGVVAILLTGCADSGLSELASYAERVMARSPRSLDPTPVIRQVDRFVYRAGDRRDPFVMDDQAAEHAAEQAVKVAQESRPSGLSPDPLRPKEPLEDYPLAALRMVGTLEQYGTRWALITSPEGTLHRVREGQHLGRNNGRITRIEPTELMLTEVVEKQPGQWARRRASLALNQ
ncbi:pilus assembly protein PilP [Halochromatium salexigens]|uniref:pilus assembly protein PilP n=1 Tax=Halochromatium salexigens TaxID=49447 RepID=UPI0030B83047